MTWEDQEDGPPVSPRDIPCNRCGQPMPVLPLGYKTRCANCGCQILRPATGKQSLPLFVPPMTADGDFRETKA
jgi:hypothetical protein